MKPICPYCPDFDPTALSNRGVSHVACPACLVVLERQMISEVERRVEEAQRRIR